MPPSISVLVTGSELLDGRANETNSHLIIQALAECGLAVEHVLSCDDQIQNIKSSLDFLRRCSDTVIVSGGLGPTSDDLTREAISEISSKELVLNRACLEHMEAFFMKRRGRAMDPSNQKQALFPAGCRIIPNPAGTAAGFAIEIDAAQRRCLVIALPGVPSELRIMVSESVLPALKQKYQIAESQVYNRRVLRIFSVPESTVGSRLSAIKPPQQVSVSYRAHFPEIQVMLKALPAEYPALELKALSERARQAIGNDHVFSESLELDLCQVLHQIFVEQAITIAIAESCTGGLLGSMLTYQPGSSKYFLGGAITYSNESKVKSLGVTPRALEQHGAVSFEVARQMAQGVRQSLGARLGLSITGVAGPEGGSAEKPVGTFFVGLSDPHQTAAYHCFFNSSRDKVRTFAAWTALDIVRRLSSGLPIPHPSQCRGNS
jgi:nicotinamide-nucleotide amidase